MRGKNGSNYELYNEETVIFNALLREKGKLLFIKIIRLKSMIKMLDSTIFSCLR